jgi:hypothetical protein
MTNMQYLKLAKDWSFLINRNGNVKLTTHFIERLFERKLDLQSDCIKKFIRLNKEKLCQLIFEQEKETNCEKSRIVRIDGICFVYTYSKNSNKLIWKTIFDRN